MHSLLQVAPFIEEAGIKNRYKNLKQDLTRLWAGGPANLYKALLYLGALVFGGWPNLFLFLASRCNRISDVYFSSGPPMVGLNFFMISHFSHFIYLRKFKFRNRGRTSPQNVYITN